MKILAPAALMLLLLTSINSPAFAKNKVTVAPSWTGWKVTLTGEGAQEFYEGMLANYQRENLGKTFHSLEGNPRLNEFEGQNKVGSFVVNFGKNPSLIFYTPKEDNELVKLDGGLRIQGETGKVFYEKIFRPNPHIQFKHLHFSVHGNQYRCDILDTEVSSPVPSKSRERMPELSKNDNYKRNYFYLYQGRYDGEKNIYFKTNAHGVAAEVFNRVKNVYEGTNIIMKLFNEFNGSFSYSGYECYGASSIDVCRVSDYFQEKVFYHVKLFTILNSSYYFLDGNTTLVVLDKETNLSKFLKSEKDGKYFKFSSDRNGWIFTLKPALVDEDNPPVYDSAMLPHPPTEEEPEAQDNALAMQHKSRGKRYKGHRPVCAKNASSLPEKPEKPELPALPEFPPVLNDGLLLEDFSVVEFEEEEYN